MAWEQLIKTQAQLASTLMANAVTRWQKAKAAANATPSTLTANQVATDLVNTWGEMLNLWLSPWLKGSPTLPILYVSGPAGGGAFQNTVALDHDVKASSISFTDLGQLGGANTISAMTGATKNIIFQIEDGSTPPVSIPFGSKLSITAITTVPGTAGLYQGLAMEGQTDPVAAVVVKLY